MVDDVFCLIQTDWISRLGDGHKGDSKSVAILSSAVHLQTWVNGQILSSTVLLAAGFLTTRGWSGIVVVGLFYWIFWFWYIFYIEVRKSNILEELWGILFMSDVDFWKVTPLMCLPHEHRYYCCLYFVLVNISNSKLMNHSNIVVLPSQLQCYSDTHHRPPAASP